MRHTVRPFIKEFKKRPPKSSAPPPPNDNTDNDSAKPAFLDLGSFAAYETNHDGEYHAALKAADALFGRNGLATSVPEETLASKDTAGRVLPSLIEADTALTVRLAEADQKARRGRKTGNPENSSSIRRSKPSRTVKADVTKISVEPPVASLVAEVLNVPTVRRECSSIQKRWVLMTELKAGQKWKRRLCKAARR